MRKMCSSDWITFGPAIRKNGEADFRERYKASVPSMTIDDVFRDGAGWVRRALAGESSRARERAPRGVTRGRFVAKRAPSVYAQRQASSPASLSSRGFLAKTVSSFATRNFSGSKHVSAEDRLQRFRTDNIDVWAQHLSRRVRTPSVG